MQLLELHRWSLSRGIAISGTKLAIDDLREALGAEPFSRQAVASQARILLEAVLDRLTIQYRRKLPRNHEGAWTLGDLLSSCTKLFKVLEVDKPRQTSGDAEGDGDGDGSTQQVAIQPFVDACAIIIVDQQLQVGLELAITKKMYLVQVCNDQFIQLHFYQLIYGFMQLFLAHPIACVIEKAY